jgi:hypothetical protein
MYSHAPMKTWAMKSGISPFQRMADHLWTVLTLVLALLLAAPAALVVSAPFMKSQPSFVYDRYGCPAPAIGAGPDARNIAGQCAKEPATEPAAEPAGIE